MPDEPPEPSQEPGENDMVRVISSHSSASAGETTGSIQPPKRTASHSLLSATNSSYGKRKGQQVGVEQTTALVERASISMPPPSSKPPMADRRFSNSKTRESEESESFARDTTLSSSNDSARSTSLEEPLTLRKSPASPTFSPPMTSMDKTSITTFSTTPAAATPVSTPLGSPPALTTNEITAMPRDSSSGSGPRNSLAPHREGAIPFRGPRPARSVSATRRRFSGSTATSTTGSDNEPKVPLIGKIGVCALDVKARSRPSRSILTRLQGQGELEVIVFGDKVILDEDVGNWPVCDFLISFFSDGFPLDKAIRYVKLRKPFVVNDLEMQKVLWDRRLCLRILDKMGVPTPRRLEVNRDGGPRLESAALARHVKGLSGVTLDGPTDGTGGGIPFTQKVELLDDGETLYVDGKTIRKPFVEKPVSGEDHNVMIYFSRTQDGGGGRRLFRKIGNKSSEFDPDLKIPRCVKEPKSSYVYEQFLNGDHAEDVKAYTVGPDFCHAETRKSPVVDGLVRRNTHGKEVRYITRLNTEESITASKVANGFGQRICGFDMLRAGGISYVIDVNGFSFVKDNNDYYDRAAKILRELFTKEKMRTEASSQEVEKPQEIVRPEASTTSSHRTVIGQMLSRKPSLKSVREHLHRPSRHPHVHPSIVNDAPRSFLEGTSPPVPDARQGTKPSSGNTQTDISPPPVLTTTNVSGIAETNLSPETHVLAPPPNSKHIWKLKGVVGVIRHADRTPKQKFKFTFHTQPFVDLLKGHSEEILLKGEDALASVEAAVKEAISQGIEDAAKLRMLRNALARKGGQPGTKVQIKPMFRKRQPEELVMQSPKAPATPMVLAPPIPETDILDLTQATTVDPQTAELGHTPTRSDSISNVTFSRFSAAENDLILDKLQLVIKWGGEPTHSARYQAQDLGKGMRDDLKIMNREVINDVHVFTSSERRVSTSAAIWAAAFLDQKDLPEDFISVRKDLLDDSNAAKDVMDKVKKKLKLLLREGNTVPEQFAWPKGMPEPSVVMQQVVELMKFHRRVMRHNFRKLDGSATASLAAINEANADGKESRPSIKVINEAQVTASIQSRWCTGEDAELFKERWEKLFAEFCDSEKADPSKISELYDSCKFDALHNKSFLEWIFMPSQALLDEIAKEEQRDEKEKLEPPKRHDTASSLSSGPSEKSDKGEKEKTEKAVEKAAERAAEKTSAHGFVQRIGFRRKSMLAGPSTPPIPVQEEKSYFKLYSGPGDTKIKVDKRLGRLRELYNYAKVLFDYIGPQEYGISNKEKLEIGLLTSLPLLREIVQDLEELQASPDAKSFIYFTKESHIYTLLNCILEGGLTTKIPRAKIPELDYLSQIKFELYEARDLEKAEFEYSIRILISPGCHTYDPLDISLDARHSIGTVPPRSLTDHQDWKTVIGTLKAKFDQVELPQSFLALNISESHAKEMERKRQEAREAKKGKEAKNVEASTSPDVK